MDLQLKGKVALITGSSSGIGASIAKTLAGEGATVIVHGRNAERTKRVADEIKKEGGKAFTVVGALSEESGAKTVVEGTFKAAGRIDILINNAGGSDVAPITWESGSLADWKEKFEQNFFSSIRVLQAVLPQMKNLGWGRVVQISTGLATQPGTFMVDYAAAKAAMNNTTVSLAKEFARFGITINTVSPGPIVTPAFERVARGVAEANGWGGDWDEIEKRFVEESVSTSVGRAGRVEEIANAVAFLASPLAGFINGANLRIDGGFVTTVN
ncbi:MAG TPA: SDR family NAD(P)-dependent oxidoreductase [Blastocatellia bacterium]|jgi:NAD(P)-dependent dehydrogenase (short-subunit alcohol dehydrogenase family)|nr:SDR family NAD(P)-dependent oxidoreductase [Blastocatellia bacterium]